MKKHPVDDLFKRKLEGMQRTPSENAWLKIQEKQPVRRRPVVWGWYAAAGVAAAVMGGYLVWQNQQSASPGSIQPQKTVAAAKPAPVDSAIYTVGKLNVPVEELAAAEKKANAEVDNSGKVLKPTYTGSGEAQIAKARDNKVPNTKAPHIQTPDIRPEPVENAPVVAIVEKTSVPMNAMQAEPMKNPVAQDIKTLPDEPAVSRVNKPEPEPTRTIVVAVETGTNEAEEKPRNTRFARVFRQLKNARAGEKVDWEEVGFNPKNLVARVDDRLRGKDERSSDKDHPKDKTKL